MFTLFLTSIHEQYCVEYIIMIVVPILFKILCIYITLHFYTSKYYFTFEDFFLNAAI